MGLTCFGFEKLEAVTTVIIHLGLIADLDIFYILQGTPDEKFLFNLRYLKKSCSKNQVWIVQSVFSEGAMHATMQLLSNMQALKKSPKKEYKRKVHSCMNL